MYGKNKKLIGFFEMRISAFFLTLWHIISQGKNFFFNFYKFNKRFFFSLFSIKNIWKIAYLIYKGDIQKYGALRVQKNRVIYLLKKKELYW